MKDQISRDMDILHQLQNEHLSSEEQFETTETSTKNDVVVTTKIAAAFKKKLEGLNIKAELLKK